MLAIMLYYRLNSHFKERQAYLNEIKIKKS